MIIVLYMGRFLLLKERVGLTVDDAPLSTDLQSVAIEVVCSLLELKSRFTVEDLENFMVSVIPMEAFPALEGIFTLPVNEIVMPLKLAFIVPG